MKRPYLSTACLHETDPDITDQRRAELHAYCDAMIGTDGTKRGASCKWCAEPCTCPRHKGDT